MEIIKFFLMVVFFYYFATIDLLYKMLFIFSLSLLMTFYSNKKYYNDNKNTSIVCFISDKICRLLNVIYGLSILIIFFIKKIPFIYKSLEVVNGWYVKGRQMLLSMLMKQLMHTIMSSDLSTNLSTNFFTNFSNKPKTQNKLISKIKESDKSNKSNIKNPFVSNDEMMDFLNSLDKIKK